MIKPDPAGCTLTLRVHPGARHNAITGTHDGALKISLTTPPTDGRANEALIAFLAELLKLPRARITLIQGQTSRTKTVRIIGLSTLEVESLVIPRATTLVLHAD